LHFALCINDVAGYGTLLWGGRRWIAAAVLLFVGGAVLGYGAASAQPAFALQQIRPLLTILRDVGERVAAAASPLERTWIIFATNARSVLWMMLGGAVFGLLPAVGVLTNGLAVGAVAALAGHVSPLPPSPRILALSILPHAIFELPALWFASAWGMKLGLAWLQPAAAGNRAGVFRAAALEAAQVFALALVLLFIAAAVEANVTLALVRSVAS
jgi:stage II sporulation protein M